ncbi:SRPBCC family protein [Streptomyces sp. Z26]|uniref:SRPBCC family protein n=1 Tax=Streptomyces sp. Z26 TaxID=2500177 RepID=UPI000EF13ECD|nr:SRPBCC family protein [Streptomyces sp. Z26]RLL67895.1 SRPBCC family protein [Streptomyces sp. Z26]
MTTRVIDDGSYLEHDGRPAVRFRRHYPGHPVARVWAAVSEPDGLRHWFPSTVRIEPRRGGRIEFADDPHAEPDTGEVLRYEPPHVLAFTWGGDELHLEVAPGTPDDPDADGCTLTLVNVLEARDTAARNAAGWHVCLGELARHLDGHATGGPHAPDAQPWRPVYERYVAAGVPHGAAVPGADATGDDA